MDLERGLQAWLASGLIDAATADAIRDHEGAARTPWGRWAVIALGLLAVALGIALVIASNWQAIPGGLRSEEHTSELQSLMRISYAVFCLKKKKEPSA